MSNRNEFKKEEDPMWDEEVEIIREHFPDPELPKNLDERLRFRSPTNKEEYNVCQNGMTYEVENEEARRMPSNRQVHPYRNFILTATESEDSAKKAQTLKEDCYVHCLSSDNSDEYDDKDDEGESVYEDNCAALTKTNVSKVAKPRRPSQKRMKTKKSKNSTSCVETMTSHSNTQEKSE